MTPVEKVSIRRTAAGPMVNVTWKVGDDTVHWQIRVLGPTARVITGAIKHCREQCAMLLDGIKDSKEE